MRAVVVGGAGFLGSAIAEELLERGETVAVFDSAASQNWCDAVFGHGRVEVFTGDILDPAALRAAFDGADEVYHLAGMLGTSELDECVLDAIHANVTGAVMVFEAAIDRMVSRVFFPAKPNVWRNTYTITKFAAEQFAQMYAADGVITIPALRYFNAYGPRQCLGPVRKLIPTFAAQALCGQPLTVYGDGSQTVDLIYSADLARHTIDFTRSGYVGDAVDLGRGVPLTVLEVANAVNEIVGNRAGLVHLPMRRGETPATQLVADNRDIEEVLGALRFVSLEQSLETTLAWYAGLPRDQIEDAAAAYQAA
jgi:nucleoside-diphosphate-sugar epimerase